MDQIMTEKNSTRDDMDSNANQQPTPAHTDIQGPSPASSAATSSRATDEKVEVSNNTPIQPPPIIPVANNNTSRTSFSPASLRSPTNELNITEPENRPSTTHPRPSGHHALAEFPSEPPSLNYTLDGRKRWIAFFWTLIIFDSVAIPLGVYFGLWFGLTRDQLNANAVFSISTACLGGVSIFEYFLRFWRLWRHNSTCRVLGARRSYLDWFHWNFSIAWLFIMVELIAGTIPAFPPIRLLAMPCSSLLFWFAFQLLVEDTLRILGYRSPIRISSVPAGSLFRPGIYSIIEDVVAVDGSGGTEFRTRLNARFEASHYFRRMLHRLTLFWAVGSMLAAVLTTTLVFTLERNPAYVVGWVLPFIWGGIWAACTVPYVKRELRIERETWGTPRSMSNLGRYSISYERERERRRLEETQQLPPPLPETAERAV